MTKGNTTMDAKEVYYSLEEICGIGTIYQNIKKKSQDGFTWQELKAASTSQSREEAIANITEADKDKDKKVNSAEFMQAVLAEDEESGYKGRFVITRV